MANSPQKSLREIIEHDVLGNSYVHIDGQNAVRGLLEQLESLRSDYARLRATLMAIEAMPVRIQLGNKQAENPAITHDGAARALRETQDSFGQVSSPASRSGA